MATFFSAKGDAVKLPRKTLRNSFAICPRFSDFSHRLTGLNVNLRELVEIEKTLYLFRKEIV
jgi:hypothetical protein